MQIGHILIKEPNLARVVPFIKFFQQTHHPFKMVAITKITKYQVLEEKKQLLATSSIEI